MSDEGARSVRKNRRQIRFRTDRTNEVNKTFIIWLFVHFLLCFQRYVCLQVLPLTLPRSELVGFSSCLHSYVFICLAYSSTTCYCSNLSIKFIPNPLLFSSKSTQKFSCPYLYTCPEKSALPSHSVRRAICFFPDLSATNKLVPVNHKRYYIMFQFVTFYLQTALIAFSKNDQSVLLLTINFVFKL